MKKVCECEAAASCLLFRGIAQADLDHVLRCMDAREKVYVSGEAIFRAGEPAGRIGVLLSGGAQVIREEYDGARTILAGLSEGELFGEAFACAMGGPKQFPVTVQSVAMSTILLLDYRKMLAVCPAACPHHMRLIQNMLAVLAEKNLLLNRRVGHLSKRSTREKLMSYLREMEAACGSASFAIPFNRQELADYLCVDRSAMSAALSKLQQEGLLRYQKNQFTLLAQTAHV